MDWPKVASKCERTLGSRHQKAPFPNRGTIVRAPFREAKSRRAGMRICADTFNDDT